MDVLKAIETIRNPFLDTFFSLITHLGSEIFFIVIAITVLWCADKRNGYYLLLTGFIGQTVNQILKTFCKIPRPWQVDPSFQPVGDSKALATGYSFPSGHTQNVTGTLGSAANFIRKTAVTAVSAAIIALVAFSRLYLGVHHPFDVLFSLVLGLILIFVMRPVAYYAYEHPWLMYVISGVMLVSIALYTAHLESIYTVEEKLVEETIPFDSVKHAYMMLGLAVGFPIVFFADKKFIHFKTEGSLLAQIAKLAVGGGLVFALMKLVKAPLYELSGGLHWVNSIRYFLVIVFAGVVWPLTFPLWNRLFKKKQKEVSDEQ